MWVNATVGKRVIVQSSGSVVGIVDHAGLDGDARSLGGLSLRETVSGGEWMRWSEVESVASDAVFVSREPLVRSLTHHQEEQMGVATRPENLSVVSDRGIRMGMVADVDVAEDTGSVRSLMLLDGLSISASSVLTVDRDVLTVRALP